MAGTKYGVFLLFLFSLTATSEPLYLHPLKTKQAIENIRFIGNDGQYTYFQKNSGALYLSRGYSTLPVFKDHRGTQYSLKASPSKRKIIATKDKTFFTNMKPDKSLDIFTLSYGKKDSQYIGQGRNPKLHLRDEWVSYYSPSRKELIFTKISSMKEWKIPIDLELSSYIEPDTLMLSDQQAIYTSLNGKYQGQVFLHYLQTGQKDLIYQAHTPGTNITLFKNDSHIFITDFPRGDIDSGSSIMSINFKKSPTLKKVKTLYNTASNDLGSPVFLNNKIYFLNSQKNLISVDKEKKLQQHIEGKMINSILEMDQKLLAIRAGEYFFLMKKPFKSVKYK